MKSHFPSKKMGKSQFPFYPFRTLFQEAEDSMTQQNDAIVTLAVWRNSLKWPTSRRTKSHWQFNWTIYILFMITTIEQLSSKPDYLTLLKEITILPFVVLLLHQHTPTLHQPRSQALFASSHREESLGTRLCTISYPEPAILKRRIDSSSEDCGLGVRDCVEQRQGKVASVATVLGTCGASLKSFNSWEWRFLFRQIHHQRWKVSGRWNFMWPTRRLWSSLGTA